MPHVLYTICTVISITTGLFLAPLSNSLPVQVVNGIQPVRRENGLSNKEDSAHFEDIIHLANHDNTTNGARDKSDNMATEPILTFESEDSFMKKAGPLKPQHVAGTKLKTSVFVLYSSGRF